MDTKSLYDWASEADLDFKNDDHHDAAAVWVDAIMESPEDLMDFWADWMYEKPERITDMLKHLGKAHDDANKIQTRSIRDNNMLISTFSSSLTLNLAWAGKAVLDSVREGLTKYVEDNADDWWSDVCGYAGDMLEGQYEDYKYEQWKDRQLEER